MSYTVKGSDKSVTRRHQYSVKVAEAILDACENWVYHFLVRRMEMISARLAAVSKEFGGEQAARYRCGCRTGQTTAALAPVVIQQNRETKTTVLSEWYGFLYLVKNADGCVTGVTAALKCETGRHHYI